MRVLLASGVAAWLGTTLVLSSLRTLNRPRLADRLAPYRAVGTSRRMRSPTLSLDSLRDVLGPVCSQAGERVSRMLGVGDDLSTRLERVHSPVAATDFRIRQAAWVLAWLCLGALATLATGPPPVIGLVMVLGAPVLCLLVMEQRTVAASEAWKRRVFLEMPVVAEQLGMLLGAGRSLGAAINRVATRGGGAVSQDLSRVAARIRTGMDEQAALSEWAALARVDAVDRLTTVLALNRQSSDLGRLVSEEAGVLRREVRRELTTQAERRAQQVWIPVTVAALVPGVMFLAVPFAHAVHLFAGT